MNRFGNATTVICLLCVFWAGAARVGRTDDRILVRDALDTARERIVKYDGNDAEVVHRTLAKVAQLYALNGDFAAAVSTAESIPNKMFRDLAYYWVAQSCLETGSVAQALTSAERIESHGYRSEVLTQIAAAELAKGRKDECERLLRESLRTALEIRSTWSRHEALMDICRVILRADGDVALTVQGVAQEVVDPFERVQLLNDVALAQGDRGDKMAGLATLLQALAALPESDDGTGAREFLLSDISLAQLELGDAAASLDTLGRIKSEIDYGRQRLSESLVIAGKFDEATRLVEKIEDEQRRPPALACVATLLAERGAKRESALLYRRAVEAALAIAPAPIVEPPANREPAGRELALIEVATQQARGDIDAAIQTARLNEQVFNHCAYSIVWEQLKQRSVEAALTTTESVADDKTKAYCLERIVFHLCEHGDPERAERIAAQIKPAEIQAVARRAVAHTYGRLGNARKAKAIMATIPNESDDIWRCPLIEFKIGQSAFADARTILSEVEDESSRVKWLTVLAQRQTASGDIDATKQWIDRWPSKWESAHAWIGFAKALLHADDE